MTAVDPKLYRGRTPAPPPELPEWRRVRMQVAIRAAILFLQGKSGQEIGRVLEREGGLEQTVVSKARIGQYVKKGVDFLVQRGCFREIR
jgi:hypothetical protein